MFSKFIQLILYSLNLSHIFEIHSINHLYFILFILFIQYVFVLSPKAIEFFLMHSNM